MGKSRRQKTDEIFSSSTHSGAGKGVVSDVSTGNEVVNQPGMTSKQTRLINEKSENVDQVFDRMLEQVRDSEQTIPQSSCKDPIPSPVKAKSYVDVVKPAGRPIEFLKKIDVEVDMEFAIPLDIEDYKPKDVPWSYSLVGYVVGSFPGKQALLECCKEWAVKFRYAPHESKWLVFHFESDEDRKRVLENGPYFVYNRPLMLKNMPPLFDFSDEERRHVPVWVKIRKLPLELWSNSAISKILSLVGTPLRLDYRTAYCSAVSYARALVSVDVSKDLLNEVRIRLHDGTLLKLQLEFEHVPPFCHTCLLIGHKAVNCGEKKVGKKSGAGVQNVQPVVDPSHDSVVDVETDQEEAMEDPISLVDTRADSVKMKDVDNGGNVNKSDSNAPSEHAGSSDLQEVEQPRKVRVASVVVIPSKEDAIHYNKDGYGREMDEDGFSPVVSRKSRRRKSREGRIFNRGRSMDGRNANRDEAVELVSELVDKARSKADNGKEKIVNCGGDPGPSHTK